MVVGIAMRVVRLGERWSAMTDVIESALMDLDDEQLLELMARCLKTRDECAAMDPSAPGSEGAAVVAAMYATVLAAAAGVRDQRAKTLKEFEAITLHRFYPPYA